MCAHKAFISFIRFLLVACTVCCSAVQEEAPAAPAAVVAPNLFEIQLPEGDVGSINIDWWDNGAPILHASQWLDQGFDGVRFRGAGVGRTHLRCTSWDGNTVVVRRHDGIVEFTGLTLHSGYEKGVQFGEQNLSRTIKPKFALRLINVHAVVEPRQADKPRTKWLLFGYQSDVYLRDVVLDAKEAREHASYWHGFARQGLLWDHVAVIASGAEGCKVRSDASETAWAGSNQWIILRDCSISNWYQTWSDRGGGGVVLQGTGAHLLMERCVVRGGGPLGDLSGAQRSKCVMVTAEGNSYDQQTGAVDKPGGAGNGWIILRQCALEGGPGPDWWSPIARVGRQGGPTYGARGVLVEGCGVWGDHMSFQLDNLPAGKTVIRGCNTSELAAWARDHGMDPTHEAAVLTSSRPVPLSEGLQR